MAVEKEREALLGSMSEADHLLRRWRLFRFLGILFSGLTVAVIGAMVICAGVGLPLPTAPSVLALFLFGAAALTSLNRSRNFKVWHEESKQD
ncbi:hypothetical protein [Microbacterium sp. 2MCAF23]|uniref:hypothetical protein n=1 Tax=Microbacterium sp. 2MCAF23 TaxID=3232985 RepID=UPI003F976579